MKSKTLIRVLQLFSLVVVLIILGVFPVYFTSAQAVVKAAPIEVKCGTIIDGEFTNRLEQHFFLIGLKAGDKLSATIVPIGTTLKTRFIFSDPTNQAIVSMGTAEQFPKLQTDVLSANGVYQIIAMNYTRWGNGRPEGVGVYTLSVSCVLRDGTIINAGDNTNLNVAVQPTAESPQQAPSAAQSPANFNGFPGLQPIDFSGAFLFPFTLGDFNNGQMPATGNGVIGYNFTGNTGQIFDLTYLRRAGNLNLGLVVLSPSNQVVFVTAMVTSDLLLSRFTLPETGQYTIGVFALNLMPPAAPVATDFQIKGILS